MPKARLIHAPSISGRGTHRLRAFPLVWPLTYPVRAYIKWFPFQRGKGLISRFLLEPLLPPLPHDFIALLPNGGKIRLRYREALGFSTLTTGLFEAAEIQYLTSCAALGSIAVDVGANVGLFTVALAQAVGSEGLVLAFEPAPENHARLEANLALNKLANVRAHRIALGSESAEAKLALHADPAFHRLGSSLPAGEEQIDVSVAPLDEFWNSAERRISVLKIDVEGAEIEVLRGAERILRQCAPVLLLEARTPDELRRIEQYLEQLGYKRQSVRGFRPWNHVFLGDKDYG